MEPPAETRVPGRVTSTGQQATHIFRLGNRFTELKLIGEGAYGVVVSGKDIGTPPSEPQPVAIKKIILKSADAPPQLTRQQLIYFQSTLREVKILKKLRHENIINIKHAYRIAFDGNDMREIYLIQDLMGPDLYKLIHVLKNPITNEHIAFFTYQIIRGIKYIHSANVIHRDLKSQNVLVNSQCDLKICDFGMARVVDERHDHRGALTEYVTTRWYRAPEIVVDPKSYTKAVDVWSIGCILGEMVTRKVLFPGSHYIHQLNLIFEGLGLPNDADINEIANQQAREYITNIIEQKKLKHKPLKVPENSNASAIDLMYKLLTFSPTKRISINDSLQHPFVKDYYYPDDEPDATEPFTYSDELENPGQELLMTLLYDATSPL